MTAQLWEAGANKNVRCQLCAHGCEIAAGKHGVCGARANVGGALHSVVADVITAINIDPVEKKPLYHFLPGTKTLSFGSAGCNFHCKFCQNSEISRITPHSSIRGRRLTPETQARLAEENGTPSVAFTYNEPTVFFEQMYSTAGLVKNKGIKTILVSNGFMSDQFLQAMANRIDAANIDLKSFSDSFYRKLCGGRLQPVLDNLKAIRALGWWLEVTTLVIPGINDNPAELKEAAEFIKTELGEDTPWHLSAFHGAAEMSDHPPTPIKTLENAWEIGRNAGLRYVYLGNTTSPIGSDTYCPHCESRLVERKGYRVRKFFKDGKCPKCDEEIAGVWR